MSEHLRQKIEILLFMARNPLSIEDLQKYLSVATEDINTALN